MLLPFDCSEGELERLSKLEEISSAQTSRLRMQSGERTQGSSTNVSTAKNGANNIDRLPVTGNMLENQTG